MLQSRVRRGVRPLALAVALALGTGAAQAATITVTDGTDAGTATTCTLRQAIVSANTNSAAGSSCVAGTSGADVINFDASLANATITLAGAAQLDVKEDLTLDGNQQTIDGANASSVLVANNLGGHSARHLTISNVTITGGNAGSGMGGGIYTKYTELHLSHVTVTGNIAGFGGGIAIRNGGQLTLDDSTVSGNTALASDNVPGYGGGIYSGSTSVTISNSTISGNHAYSGGGIHSERDDALILTNVTVTGNQSQVDGGGLRVRTEYATQFAIRDSTIAGNSTANSGGGIAYFDASEVPNPNGALTNDIVAGNTAGTASDADIYGSTFPVAQSNLLGSALATFYPGNGNIFNDVPGLGALADNGGPTWTMALQPGSPAIDAGGNALVPTGLATDQRGAGFNRVINITVDIGAFELGAGTTIPPVASPSVPVPVGTPWALGLLAGLLGFFGFRYRRREA